MAANSAVVLRHGLKPSQPSERGARSAKRFFQFSNRYRVSVLGMTSLESAVAAISSGYRADFSGDRTALPRT